MINNKEMWKMKHITEINPIFFCLFERDRECAHAHVRAGKGREKMERENPKWLHAVSAKPHAGLDLTNHEIKT